MEDTRLRRFLRRKSLEGGGTGLELAELIKAPLHHPVKCVRKKLKDLSIKICSRRTGSNRALAVFSCTSHAHSSSTCYGHAVYRLATAFERALVVTPRKHPDAALLPCVIEEFQVLAR